MAFRSRRAPKREDTAVDKFASELKDHVRRKPKNDAAVNFELDILPPNTLERALSKAERIDDRRPKFRLGVS